MTHEPISLAEVAERLQAFAAARINTPLPIQSDGELTPNALADLRAHLHALGLHDFAIVWHADTKHVEIVPERDA